MQYAGTATWQYFLNIDANGEYLIGYQNTGTGTWYWADCYDSDNPSTYVDWLAGSAELNASSLTHAFDDSAAIRDEWTWQGYSQYRPETTFNYSHDSDEVDYVEMTHQTDGSNRFVTGHYAGYSP